MKKLLTLVIAVGLLSPALIATAESAQAVGCGSPTHLTFDNAHVSAHDGYWPGSSQVQYGSDFALMDVWSPDPRLSSTSTPTTVQTMDICSIADWSATVTETDPTTCTAPDYICHRVFDYPSSEHRLTDYDPSNGCSPEQSWNSYSQISSSWSWGTQPSIGDWDQTYDVWMGSFGDCAQTGIPQIELMSYTKWNQNIFAPSSCTGYTHCGFANFTTQDGNNYDAWYRWSAYDGTGCLAAAGCLYIQTRNTTQANSGTIHLRQIMQKMNGLGLTYNDGTSDLPAMPTGADVASVKNGVEVVSDAHTIADGPITFNNTGFSVTMN